MIRCPNCASQMFLTMHIHIWMRGIRYEAPVLICTRCPATSDVDASRDYELVDYQYLRFEQLRFAQRPGLLREMKEKSLRHASYLVNGES